MLRINTAVNGIVFVTSLINCSTTHKMLSRQSSLARCSSASTGKSNDHAYAHIAMYTTQLWWMLELVVGGSGLTVEEKSVIDRCLPKIYERYFENPT